MRLRRSLAVVLGLVLALIVQGVGQSAVKESARTDGRLLRQESSLPDGFLPAVARAHQLGRYFVEMKAGSVSDAVRGAGVSTARVSATTQQQAKAAALRSQAGAIAQARSLGGSVTFRYSILLNAFSAKLSPQAASALAQRADVRSVQPVSIVKMDLSSSVPFIGAPQVWDKYNVRGQGMHVAVVDTGIDYTHASFGGEGTVEAYEANDPTVIEPGSFPTGKVIGGYDFVGENYDVLDADTSNDIPHADFDPLDEDGHGSHTASTVAGIEVAGHVGKGVAPAAKLFAYKVWDVGNSTDDVLVAAYERAVDPNQDGNVADAVDVLSFSGGVDYGTLNSLEAKAAQRVVDLGTVFVASAGNSGNQPSGGSAYISGTPSIARGVIGVAASIDQFLGLDLDVNSPPGIVLPLDGLTVHQSWSGPIPSGGLNDVDLFDGRAVDPNTAQHFCNPLPADSLTGEVVVVFRNFCAVSTKTFNAQEAGAIAVVVRNNAGGAPVALATNGEDLDIPSFMIGRDDADAILAVLSPGGVFNSGAVNVSISDVLEENPAFVDAMTSFTSEGPARLTNDLKPDISAPGSAIEAAAVGTGNEAVALSGTSMAAPHISGVATLLRQLHPSWTVAQIKAVLMNQAKKNMNNNDLSNPVPATVMGAGRVQALESANAKSVAWPGSLSFNFAPTPTEWSKVRTFKVKNFHNKPHGYTVTGNDRYSDYDPALTDVTFSTNGTSFGASRSFNLNGGQTQQVWVKLTLDPSAISEAEQEFGWYYFLGSMDGNVQINQSGSPSDVLKLPWHVVPLTTSDNGIDPTSLDLTGGPGELTLTEGTADGTSYADLYHLGTTDPAESRGEEDIVAVGARSFTGATIDGDAEGVPPGEDELGGNEWMPFLSSDTDVVEPVEIGVQTWGIHNITETLEVDVLIDVGADGDFADEDLQADFLAVKQAASGGEVCLFDLSLPDPFDDCAALYFPDYSNYNSNLVGVVFNAEDIGLSDGNSTFSYRVEACTGTFSGDVPDFICDHAGELSGGTWNNVFDAADPALAINPLTCQGFWGGPDCTAGSEITVDVGSAGAGDDPSILVLFPNDRPHRTATVVETTT